MSIKLMSQVWDNRDLRGPSLILMLAMADWASEEGIAFPKVDAITRKTRMGKTQVYDFAATLEATGHLQRLDKGQWLVTPCPETRKVFPEIRTANSGNPENPPAPPLKEEPSINRQVPLAASPQGRPRNLVWDALVLATAAPATKAETADFAKTVKELTAAAATPEQISGFGPWWLLTYPGASLTHRCYRLHWGAFLASVVPAASRSSQYLS